MTQIFDLWPAEGERCVAGLKDGQFRHVWVASAEEAEAQARKLDSEGFDAYYAMATFQTQSRKREHAAWLQCLWADIDYGPDKRYVDKDSAEKAIVDLIETGALPNCWAVVHSGHGLHVYWKLSEPVRYERWKPLAERFKALLLSLGLKFDSGCTADAARVLRVPGTTNRKFPEAPVKVTAAFVGREYGPNEFEKLIGDAQPRPSKLTVNEYTAGLDGDYTPARIGPIEEGCAQMAAVKAAGGTVSEPLWRAALSVLWRSEDGEELIHDWSKGDPRYDPDETTAKAEGTLGPQLCSTFREAGDPALCDGCPHWGKIKSPIVLGHPSVPVTIDPASPSVMLPNGHWSDEVLASAFTKVFGHKLRFVDGWGKWMVWNGQCWVKDETRAVLDMARKVCKAAAQAIGKQDRSLGSKRTIEAVETLARADRQHAATVDQWDADPKVLNTPDGIYILDDRLTRMPHDPERYQTKMTAVAPDFDMPTPIWDAVLERITDGDKELQKYLQRGTGYCLTGETGEHVLFFNYGTGANGKSVFVETIAGILGAYHVTAPMDMFMASKGDKHPTDLAMLKAARLVTASETAEGRHWDEAKVKRLTGGDQIAARFMRQDFFQFRPQFKLMMSGNQKPGLRSVDEAMRRRLHLIPFTVTIPAEERDPKLPEKLKAEWPGILAWMMKGCTEWRRQKGLAPPEKVIAATDEYLADEDSLGQWLDAATERDAQAFEASGMLYESWKSFCEATGEHPGSKKQLSRRLTARGFKHVSTAKARGFQGLRLIAREYLQKAAE